MLILYMKIYLILFFITTYVNTFCVRKNFNINHNHIKNIKNNKIIKMNYDNFKNYDDIISFLPTFQASIIINNWINSVQLQEKEIKKIEKYDEIEKSIPEYIKKSIYDMKFFISINRNKKNTILLAWSPENSYKKKSVVYIIGCKLINNIVHVERIAQNPYYNNIIDIKSINFVKELEKIVDNNSGLSGINYDELHKYDIRFKLSWELGYYEN